MKTVAVALLLATTVGIANALIPLFGAKVNITFDGSSLEDGTNNESPACVSTVEHAVAETMDTVLPAEINATNFDHVGSAGVTIVTVIISTEEVDDDFGGRFEEETTEFNAAVSGGRFTLFLRDFAASDQFNCNALKTAFAQTEPTYFTLYTPPPTVAPTEVPSSEPVEQNDSIGGLSLEILIAIIMAFILCICISGALYYYYFYHFKAIKKLEKERAKCDPDQLVSTEAIDPIDVERSTRANLRALSKANTAMNRTMSRKMSELGYEDGAISMGALQSPRPGQAANLGMAKKHLGSMRGDMSRSMSRTMSTGGTPMSARGPSPMSARGPSPMSARGTPMSARGTPRGASRAFFPDQPSSARGVGPGGRPMGAQRGASMRFATSMPTSSRNQMSPRSNVSSRNLFNPPSARGARPMSARQASYANRMGSRPGSARDWQGGGGSAYGQSSNSSSAYGGRESLYSNQQARSYPQNYPEGTLPQYGQYPPQQGYPPDQYSPRGYPDDGYYPPHPPQEFKSMVDSYESSNYGGSAEYAYGYAPQPQDPTQLRRQGSNMPAKGPNMQRATAPATAKNALERSQSDEFRKLSKVQSAQMEMYDIYKSPRNTGEVEMQESPRQKAPYGAVAVDEVQLVERSNDADDYIFAV